MVKQVKGEFFFHINSNANLSKHDLMRIGAVIEIGKESCPFFNIYETWQRTYPVRNTNTGQIRQVPAMEFLNGAREGAITPDNLAQTAYETAQHFLMLARELLWETVRLNEFPDAPSWQRCIWLTRTLGQARDWIKVLKFQPSTYWIVKLAATGRALDTDGRLLASDSEALPAWYEKARAYWRGEMTADPWSEVIFDGEIKVDEIIGR